MINRLILLLLLAVFLTGCSTPRGRNVEEIANKSDSVTNQQVLDVVGVLVGYHTSIRLSTRQSMFTFTMTPDKACCSDVYLFSVLTPIDLQGRFFYVNDIGPALDNPERLFKIGTRYCFKLKVNSSENSNPWIGSCVLEPGVREVSISKEEADARLARLNQEEALSKKQIARAKKALKRDDLRDVQRKAYERNLTTNENILQHIAETREIIAKELKYAKDDYPDLYDLKWKLLDDEGWKTIPRKKGVIKEFDKLINKEKSQQPPSGDRLKAPEPVPRHGSGHGAPDG